MQQFDTLNRQQQPFIQSGYGAMGKLNTLLGLGSRPRMAPGAAFGPPSPMPGVVLNNSPNAGQTFRPMPNGGMQQIVSASPQDVTSGPKMDPRAAGGVGLKRILMLRAMNGDSEAARMLGMQ